jgi:hypothetical protein
MPEDHSIFLRLYRGELMSRRPIRLVVFCALLAISIALLIIPFRNSSASNGLNKKRTQTSGSRKEGPPNYDAFSSQAKRKTAASDSSAQVSELQQTQAGHRVQIEPRLGVPTFLWAPASDRKQQGEESLRAQDKGSIEAAARGHLGENGSYYSLSDNDVAVAKLVSVHDTGKGAIIAKFKQEIGGIEVFRDEINVVMNRDLQLVALTGYLTGDDAASQNFSLQPAEALSKALEDLTGTALSPSALRGGRTKTAPGEAANPYTLYTADAAATQNFTFSDEPARVKKVMYHLVDGYVPAYYVEAFVLVPSEDATVISVTGDPVMTELAYSYVISAVDGQLLFRHNLIAADTPFTYRVWADPTTKIPYDSPAGNGPHPKLVPLPDGAQAPFVAMQDVTLQNFSFSRNDPWLAPGATATNGNNVDAFVNLFSPDDIGTPTTTSPTDVPNGDHRAFTNGPDSFLYTHQPDVDAFSANARQASITQLFYNINFLHDWFYDAGFDEASGNAQTNNYGRGGLGSDNIRAQAQDFQSFNNANMLTPADGSRPRMRMYNFPNRANMLDVQAPAAIQSKLGIGISQTGLRSFDITSDIVIATFSNTPSACTITNAAALAGKIAMFNFDNTDGTGCAFSTRITRIHATDAVAALMVYNSAPANANGVASITGINSAHTKGIGVISWNAAAPIKTQLAASETVTARLLRVADRDGALDNQMVAHEWGHYISNRLIGNAIGLNNQQGGGMGEGWGDFIGMLLTVRPDDTSTPSNATWGGAYASATYSSSGVPFSGALNHGYYLGNRRTPYSTDMTNYNALTFKHIQDGEPLPAGPPIASGGPNSEVHNTGEVWATMLWECYASLLRDTQGASPRLTFNEAQTRMKYYLVAAFKMTPNSPTILEARDAVLAAAFAFDYTDGQRFAAAFAKRGAGIGAIGPDRFSTNQIGVTESYTAGGELSVVSIALDDSVDGCDGDGYLDKNEKGLVTVTIRNTGYEALNNATATISSSNPNVTFPNGTTLTFPATQPNQNATATVQVALANISAVEDVTFTITIQDAGPPVVGPVVANYSDHINVDDAPNTSATDTVEARQTPWTNASSFPFDANVLWRRIAPDATSANHAWFAPTPGKASDQQLVSPVMTVDGSGSFNLQFDHEYGFEFDAGANYDGGIVEMSVNGGTWTDINTSAYTGTLVNYTGNLNPLKGRAAFVKNSGGTVHTSLTRAVAPGSTVQIRFRLGSDNAVGAFGWQVDNIALTGIVETPFPTIAADPDACHPPTPPPPASLQLTPGTLPSGTINSPYTTTVLTPSGGTGPYTLAITPFALPQGLIYNVVVGTLEISGTPTRAGTFPVNIRVTDTSNNQQKVFNYTIIINKIAPVITWSDPADITYGTALDSTQLNATTGVPGTLSYTPVSGTVLNASAGQTLTANFVPTDTDTYSNASKNVTINVLKATPTITWSNPADITYGTALDGTQLNATASVPGTLVYTPPSGTVLNVGAGQTLSVNFTPTDTANYNDASKNVSINVLKATPLITWSNPADITYGTALDGTQFNATASVPGAFVYNPLAGTVLDAGNNQTLSVDFTPTDTANYNNTSKNVSINVLKATPTITWSNPADIAYGTALDGTQLNATANVPGAFVYNPLSGMVLNAGNNQTLSVDFTPTDTVNYSNASKNVTINVLKATPTITWSNPADITYGTPLGSTQLNATASVPGTLTYTPPAGTVLNAVPNQNLSVNFAPTDTVNYNNASKNVSINVLKATPTITWSNPADITYGTALNGTQLNATTGVPGAFVYTPTAGTVLDAGNNQTLSVDFTPTDTVNYNTASKNVSINVLKATPVIAWSNPADILYGTALGNTQLNATTGVPGVFTYTPPAGTLLNAGNNQSLSVNFVPTDTNNYNNASKGVLINVLKATPTITWSNPADITYGTALNGTQLNATASVPGAFVYNPLAGTILNAGNSQTLSVDFTPTDTANYNNTSKNVSINVLKATPTITWSNPADITYGTALNGTQLNATTGVPGAFVYTPPVGTVLNAGNNQNLSVNFVPTDTANYNDASKNVSINVLKATPVITWSNPADILYGTALGNTQLNATASVPGTLTYTPIAGTVLNVLANQTLSVNFVPTDTVNYNNTSKTVSINVLKATPTITWSNPADITYGTALGSTQLNATASVPGVLTYTPPTGTLLNLGNNQNLSVDFTPTDTVNYNTASKNVSINVLKAPTLIGVTSSVNPSDFGQAVTFTATVTSGAGTPTGTVQFKDGATNLGSPVNLNGSGVATFQTSTLSAASTHAISATYNGDASFVDSNGTLTGGQVVNVQPGLSINDVSITEGDSGTTNLVFTISLSAASTLPVSVNYSTANGTATTGGSDYQSASGPVTFTPGVTTQNVSVTINGDIIFELDETFVVNLATPVNATISDSQATGTILNDDNAGGTIRFDFSNYNVNENAGLATVTVERVGGNSNAVTVNYTTSDTAGLIPCNVNSALASERCDYTTSIGTLQWVAGEGGKKSFIVPIINDVFVEGAETFNVSLSNVVGASLGTQAQSTVTITDNDSAPSSGNPIDLMEFFIRQQYLDFLGRLPDETGFKNWLILLVNCPNGGVGPLGTTNPQCDRVHVAKSFFQAAEFQGRGYFAYRFYEAAYGRRPDYAEFMPDMALIGGPKSPQEEAAAKEQFVNQFVLRSEFAQKYGLLPTPASYVDALLQTAGLPNHPGRNAFIASLATKTRAEVLRDIVESTPVEDRFYTRGFVSMMYFGFLHRDPDSVGFDNYVQKLNQTGDPRQMVFDFIYAAEYRGRFGQP